MGIKRIARNLVIALVAVIVLFAVLSRLAEVDYGKLKSSIRAPVLSEVADGSWEGSAFVLPVSVRVRVAVEDGRITGIDLTKHFNGQGKPGEAVIGRVLEAQSLDVDAVAGATHSSLTILKAIAAALGKGAGR